MKRASYGVGRAEVIAAAVAPAQPDRSAVQGRCLSMPEAAAYLGASDSWLAEVTRQGTIPTLRIGGRVVYDRVDLDAYVHEVKLHASWRADRGALDGAPTAGSDGAADRADLGELASASDAVERAGSPGIRRPRGIEFANARSAACRELEAVIQRATVGAAPATDVLAAFGSLERSCGGDWVALDASLRSFAGTQAGTHELWFSVGRTAASSDAAGLAARIGRFLADTSAAAGSIAYPAGRVPRAARGLHLLALVSTRLEAGGYAEMAASVYRRGMYAPPADIVRVIAAARRRRGGRVRRQLLDGIPADLAWHEIELVTSEPDEHSAILKLRGQSQIVTFEDLCMGDSRGRRPSKRWALLKVFGGERGRIRRPLGPGVRSLEELVECMRQDLRMAFGIAGDPIRLVSDGGRKWAWQCAFRVEGSKNGGGGEGEFDD